MKERPILFSAPMVCALLAGTKTQTRRVVKPQPQMVTDRMIKTLEGDPCVLMRLLENTGKRCPYGQPGDRLWVRETWAHYQTVNHRKLGNGGAISEVSDGLAGYRADGHGTIEDFRNYICVISEIDLEAVEINGDRWKTGIHMPRWASRTTLEITGVRVERLQDVSESDAIAEGILKTVSGFYSYGDEYNPGYKTARDAYRGLWGSINGPGSWDANPWVWVVEFKKLEGWSA